jgi:hypothetical protein
MNTPRLNGFFDWLKRGAVPIDGFAPRDDNARAAAPPVEMEMEMEMEQERDVAACRVEPLPCEPVRWGNFR